MTEALALAERAVALAPGFDLARDFLIRLLLQTNRLPEALSHAEILAASPMTSPGHELLKASVLVRLGDQHGAREIFERLLAHKADQPQPAHETPHSTDALELANLQPPYSVLQKQPYLRSPKLHEIPPRTTNSRYVSA